MPSRSQTRIRGKGLRVVGKRWRARVKRDGYSLTLGVFDTYEEAKAAEEAWWERRGKRVNGKAS